jgi:alpha-glucosidase (family GH31 glycosyl hydrolase)
MAPVLAATQVHVQSYSFRFIFKDQYIELTTNVPEDADLYGLGEVSLPTGLLLPRDGTVITMWARDLASAMPYVNLYGSHPFYLQINRGE